jgi:predicted ATPase/DNA-binding SARP family transcriptional activator
VSPTATATGERSGYRRAILAAVSPSLEIRVLGPLEVERAGELLPIGSAMQRRLLTTLVVANGETVSADRLVDALWGADPPETARNGLQTYVARLRRSLPDPSLVVTRPPGYALDRSQVRVDAWTFRDLVGRARRSPDEDPAATAAALAEGLAAWRGPAYGEFADDVARGAATHLDDLRSEAVELLAQAQLRRGLPAEAVAALDGLPSSAALRESATLLRARALAAAGRLPDALTAIRSYRDRLADELGLDASATVDELEQQLLRGELEPTVGPTPIVTAEPGRTAITAEPGRTAVAPPRLLTETLGRAEDHERITAALAASQLVTLVGPGGVGKTRLAMAVGTQGGGAWVELAPVRRDDDVAPAFAEGLGIAVPPGTTVVRAVAEALANVAGTVVVDNCEHVLDPVAELLGLALSRSDSVRILATSRERLDVAGETVVPVAPLAIPPADGATEHDPAVRLFLDRLAEAGGAPVGPRAAAEVVAAVDGLPLAIELAAARAAALPIDDLLTRLGARLDVLEGTRRRHGERHQTLDQVITWSHDLLQPAARTLFRRLSVFTATFRLADAERICAGDGLPREAVAPSLARLVEASMVTRRDDARYRVLEPLRLYGAVRLEASGEAATVQARQRDAALELTARAADAMSGPGETAAVVETEMALTDLRAVHARALESGDLATVARMAAELYRFAYLQARSDVLRWGTALAGEVGAEVAEPDRAGALAAAATGSWLTGDLAAALGYATAADQLTGDPWSRIAVTEVLGDVRLAVGDLNGAVDAFTENAACADAVGHLGLTATAEIGLAFTLFQRGDHARAGSLARSALQRAAASGSPSVQALAEYTLGEVLAADDPDGALAAFARAEALAVAGRARFHEGLARTADVALRGRHGPPDEALRRYRVALELWRDSGADGLLLTALRNLIVLFVRIGADEPALQIHAVTERLAAKPSYGDEARRLDAALAAARERLAPEVSRAAASASADVPDLRAAAGLALATITSL